MGCDLMQITQRRPLLTCIDYHTRLVKAEVLESKEPLEIKSGLVKIFNEIGKPEKLITENGKEFTNKEVSKLLNSINTTHHTIPAEKHQSNDRVERVHRDIWQLLRKKNVSENTSSEELKEVINTPYLCV